MANNDDEEKQHEDHLRDIRHEAYHNRVDAEKELNARKNPDAELDMIKEGAMWARVDAEDALKERQQEEFRKNLDDAVQRSQSGDREIE